MTIQQIIHQIAQIKQANPKNLMAKHFNPEFFSDMDEKSRERLLKIIATGMQNPTSEMGAYAMHPDDYDKFATQLAPMIREFHRIPQGTPIAQIHDWNTKAKLCDLGEIDPALSQVSMRVRVARNLSTFPLPGAMDKVQRLAFEQIAAAAFLKLAQNPDFGGKYLSITPGTPNSIDDAEYNKRVAAHQMFKDMSNDKYLNVAGISNDWPFGRGMYISEKEDFIVWVGEEDHLRIMSMQTGGNLNALFERLHSGLTILEGLLPPFAMSNTYGSVSSCPTNLGAGMRASLHVKLPNLSANDPKLARLTSEANKIGLAIRGAGGEHSGAGEGGLVDISPSARLGVTEMQIMQRLYNGVTALWKLETA